LENSKPYLARLQQNMMLGKLGKGSKERMSRSILL